MNKQIFPRWLPLQVARFYEFPLELTGKGQSAAIISLGGKIDPVEMETDLMRSRTPLPKLDYIDVDPENITEQQDTMFNGETHLDVEVLASFCPEAHISILRGSWNGGFAAAIHRAVDMQIPVISISWGYPEYMNQDFMEIEKAIIRARDAGITICASSGDAGSSATFSKPAEIGPAEDMVRTFFTPQAARMSWHAAVPNCTWKTNTIAKPSGTTSSLKRAPPAAASASCSKNRIGKKTLTWCTPTPVRMAGSCLTWPGWRLQGTGEIFMSGHARPAGGTSAVAPLWAALFIMVNEVRAGAGKPPIGFVNPLLYELAKQPGLFRDIGEGHNRFNVDYPGYDARQGFDACTGWGTPNAKTLIDLLANS